MTQEENFYKVPKSLWKADGYISPRTGKPIELKSSEKIIYVYMLDRLNFFVNRIGKKHFESQETIAKECGLERKSVARAMEAFVVNGVVEASKDKPEKGRERWFYHSINSDLQFWRGCSENPELIVKQLVGHSNQGLVSSKQNTKPNVICSDDEPDLPF